jgi:hypothetical protein
MATTLKMEVTFETLCCSSCGLTYGVPETYKTNLRESHQTFYCPNGHSQWFPGKSEAEKLRDELKRKEQELSDRVIEKISVQNQLDEANRKLKRVHKGTCPCCKRSFTNLKLHMKIKHPDLMPS